MRSETLLKYPGDTAGGLMQVELLSVPEAATVDETIQAVRANAEEVSTFHVVYVVDDDGRLPGRILHDDAEDVLEEEAEEDIMRMAGTTIQKPELVCADQVLKIAGVRLPWLLATLAGLTEHALLVCAFQVSFPEMLALVPYFFRLIKIDPAIAAGPRVTTIDDIIAVGIYCIVAFALIT